MEILLATNNEHKIFELKELLKEFPIHTLDTVLKPLTIHESGKTFKENALIKARAVFDALNRVQKERFIILADDSGICVDVLDARPGIYSKRLSAKADDKSNCEELIRQMAVLHFKKSKAHYVAALALVGLDGEWTMHASMHGHVIDTPRGQNGFGYDSLFIPKGFNKTLAELSREEKNKISHRFKALELAKIILKNLKENNEKFF